MPNFSAFEVNFTAKGKCTSDGEIYTTDASNGHTVPVIPSTYTAFLGVPVRSGTGVWAVTTRLNGFRVTQMQVKTMTTTANALDVIYQAPTLDSNGRTVLNWTFCTLGTATPADIAASQKFLVAFEASEASIA
jgi:hypothetical protein